MKNAFLLCCLFFLSCSNETFELSYSDDKSDIKAYNLITPKEADQLLNSFNEIYIPIQVSKKKIFLKEHIYGAKNIWRPDYGSDISHPYGGLIPTKEKLQKLLQNLGYKKGKTLLLYDVKANVDAMRFAWVLNLYGFDNFKIINGGLTNWKLNGLEVTNKITTQDIVSNFILKDSFDDSILANFDDLMAAIKDTQTVIVDTRESYEFKGQPFIFKDSILNYKKGAFNRGSIPTSVHLNWSTLADLDGDHRIKSESDLRYDLQNKGIHSDKNIILYCHSGSRTSHTFYILKHVLGFENVKNYDGSWIEWSYKNSIDTTVPIQQICSDLKFDQLKDSLTISLEKL